MQFYFKDNRETKKADSLIFAMKDRIIRYYFKLDTPWRDEDPIEYNKDYKDIIKVFYTFQEPLTCQPLFFKLDPT